MSEELKLNGKIVTRDGAPAAKVHVTALDKNTGNDVNLGEDDTDNSGNYTILYSRETLKQSGKTNADIQIKVTDPDDTKKIYGLSSVHYNAGSDVKINLVLPIGKIEKTPEYKRIITELKPYTGGRALKDMQENKDRQDISYLANKTGWDARLVAMVCLADKYGVESKIPAEFYYALFRAGLPTDANKLCKINARTVRQAWKKAMEENIIDPALKKQINTYARRFTLIARDYLLKNAKAVGVSTLKTLLDISMPDIKKQRQFVTLYFNHTGEMKDFWTKAAERFGKETAANLRLDGKLAALTVDNAPLIKKLRDKELITDNPVDLVRKGLYKPENWKDLLGEEIPIPKRNQDTTGKDNRKNYIDYMVYQLKRSYPTAVLGEMVNNGELKVNGGETVKNGIHDFFRDNQGAFEIGKHPVEQFLKEKNINLEANVLQEVKKLQRVYQISPSDEAMKVLWKNGFDSALSIVQYGEEAFIKKFQKDLDGEYIAKLIHAKAHQVHGTVLNLAASYLTHRANPGLYAISGHINEKSLMPKYAALGGADIESSDGEPVVYPTLEGLFGSMDFCACEHCRSVLSPAAYLVDLLQFIDLKPGEVEEGANPLSVLLTRRPDIEHIQLTCDNTNTVLPYIDLVNEILEYYAVHRDKNNTENWIYNTIEGFEGHNIEDGITSEELLANPQFVNDRAYTILKEQEYPFNLPFNYFLEALRLYYSKLGVPLYEAMEKLRLDERLDTAGGADDQPYAWRDIYNEYLGISLLEYEILTNSEAHNLPACFGEEESMPFVDFNLKYTNAKTFARRTGISYNDLIEIIKTPFINPHSHLIPKKERLGITFDEIKKFKNRELSREVLRGRIPGYHDLDQSRYGGDVFEWLRNDDNYDKIMHLILLSDTGGGTECDFGGIELRYSLPVTAADSTANMLTESDYWRLFRFIRLWKKLGWTIQETGKVAAALYDHSLNPDEGFKDLLIKIAHVTKIMEKLNLKRKKNLIKLLALWSDIDTHGSDSLYQRMFLHSTILKIDDVFLEDGYGGYLQDANEKITAHLPALQAAFNLTAGELFLILADANLDSYKLTAQSYNDLRDENVPGEIIDNLESLEDQEYESEKEFVSQLKETLGEDQAVEYRALILKYAGSTPLFLENVSKIYRYGFLARVLKLSIQEFITLKTMSGIDPFAELEDVHPSTLKFIEQAQLIEQSGFKITTLDYLLRHEDITGDASPSIDSTLSFAKTIKDGLVRIEQEHTVEDDPTGEITKTKMALVYDNDTVDRFFGFLVERMEYPVFSVEYTHPHEALEKSMIINDRLSYDHKENRLDYRGIMADEERGAFRDAAHATEEFRKAIDELYQAGIDFLNEFPAQFPDLEEFLDIFPGLEAPFKSFIAFTGHENERISVVLESILPAMKKKLKHLFIKQTLGDSANIDPALLGALLENKEVIHSVESTDEPAVKDFLELEENGVSSPRFYLEVPNNEFYRFYLDADTGAAIVFLIDGAEISGSITDKIWQTNAPIELTAGKLYLFEVEITGTADITSLKWESTGIGKNRIPVKYMYPYERVQNFSSTYLRVLKAAALTEGLALSGEETRFFGTHTDFQVDGNGFLNAIPTAANTGGNVNALFGILMELFRYARLKESLKIKDQRLVTIFENPAAKDENDESLLLKVTGWDETSKNELLNRFNWSQADLPGLEKFARMNDAVEIVKKFGVPVVDLLEWTTNQPGPETVRDIQCSFKAKYDNDGWLAVLQPINDTLRDRRRDALVSHVLHQMQRDPGLQAIDTPDKLFEYFLIDVEMEPCMKTSRIKQAISSVQLFIQRCLMNLEPRVSPVSIKTGQWEWKKHYRVWETNRKVFLYPENWLEPELRDNKSPFFRDFEGELTQADITDELAVTALLNYLEKLDEVAKLEICAVYLQENEYENKDDDILHVFGRTAGASRKYYYRKYDGTWWPWEKVDLDIEDNPILPVVWKNRLFLFWLNIITKGADGDPLPVSADDDENTKFTDLTKDQLNQPVKQSVEVNLSWSEYYNNKWQPRKTSDFENPVKLGDFYTGGFKRNHIFLRSYVGSSGELFVKLRYQALDYESEFYIDHYFKLYNKHSSPIRDCEDINGGGFESDSSPGNRRFITYGNTFKIDYLYSTTGTHERYTHEILQEPHFYGIVAPNHPVANIYEAPFFCQDRKHVFFVEPEDCSETLPDNDSIGSYALSAGSKVPIDIPSLEYTRDRLPDPGDIKPPGGMSPGSSFAKIPGIGQAPVNMADAAVNVSKVLFDRGTVNYNNEVIGALGSGHAVHLVKSKIGKTGFEKSLKTIF